MAQAATERSGHPDVIRAGGGDDGGGGGLYDNLGRFTMSKFTVRMWIERPGRFEVGRWQAQMTSGDRIDSTDQVATALGGDTFRVPRLSRTDSTGVACDGLFPDFGADKQLSDFDADVGDLELPWAVGLIVFALSPAELVNGTCRAAPEMPGQLAGYRGLKADEVRFDWWQPTLLSAPTRWAPDWRSLRM